MTRPKGTWIMARGALAVGAALLAQQATPAGQPEISAQALAATEATLDHCAQVDAKSAALYWEQGKSLVQGVSQDAVAKIRNSDEYRQAYDSTAEMIARVPQAEALNACSGIVAVNR